MKIKSFQFGRPNALFFTKMIGNAIYLELKLLIEETDPKDFHATYLSYKNRFPEFPNPLNQI
jgi:hypothetical protein